MTKRTTSDEIKALFAQFGGEEKDWKRLSKKKNEDDQWVRAFENKKTGAQLEVLETADGKFLARQLGDTSELSVAANESFAKEETAAPIEVTEEVIKDLLDDGTSPGMPQEQADKVLASLHCFALCKDELGGTDRPMAMVTSIRFFEANGCLDDQSGPIGNILEGCYEAMESVYEFADPAIRTPVDAANHLKKLGIQWNKDLQEAMDPSLTKELEAWAQLAAKKAPAPAQSKKPGPKT